MQSRNAYILGSFVIPEGATSGIRIEFDAENGVILVYDENDDLIGWISPDDGTDASGTEYFAGVGMHPQENTLSGGSRTSVTLEAHNGRVRFTRNPNHPGPPAEFVTDGEIRGYNPNGSTTVGAMLHVAAPGTVGTGYMQMTVRSQSADTTTEPYQCDISPESTSNAAQVNATEILTAGFHFRKTMSGGSYITEVWNDLTMQNGWVADGETPQYKMMADGTVVLRGNMKDGTTANGTIIANVPANYRPFAANRFITAEKQTGLAYRHIRVNTNGDIDVWNCTTAHICLDGVRFPIV